MNYPTVTEILSPWADFSRVPPAVLAAAAARGTAVHTANAAIAQGFFPVITDETAPYVGSFQAWLDATVEEVLLVEERLVDMDMGFSGQIDLLCRTGEGVCLIDEKTPVTKLKTWRAQLAAYHHLCVVNGYSVDRVGSLRLSPDGRMARMDYYDPRGDDLTAFMCCLNAYRYFHA